MIDTIITIFTHFHQLSLPYFDIQSKQIQSPNLNFQNNNNNIHSQPLPTMHKNFFTQLGNQLCNLKDSPFVHLNDPQSNNPSFRGMSFQPNRLLNLNKHQQNEQIMEQQYLKFKQKQKQNQLSIQYDLLKKNINEQYQKQLSNIENLQRTEHKQPYSWFGIYRGSCQLCSKCPQYEGCFSYSQHFSICSTQFTSDIYNNAQDNIHNNIQLMQCYKCKCPMNAHIPITDRPLLRSQIFNHLSSKTIQDSSISFNHIILCFKIPTSDIHNYQLILSLLNNLNCPVENYTIISKLNFQLSMIKSIIIRDISTEKSAIESLLNLLSWIKMERQWKWQQNQQDNHIHELYQELYDIIKKIAIQINNHIRIQQNYSVVVFLCRYQLQNAKNLIKYLSKTQHSQTNHLQFTHQILGSTITASTAISSLNSPNDPTQPHEHQLSPLTQKYNIKFIYGTNSHHQSLILSQYLFNEYYRIHYNIFMLPGGSLSASSIGTDIKQNQYNSYRFKDILDYNNYILFIQNFKGIQRIKLQQTMSKILQFRTTKINYILGQEILHQKIQKLNLKLTAKIGSPTITIPFNQFLDFVTVKNTNKMQIYKILKCIYPQFIYSQRCIIILRPFLINNNIQQIIVNLLRINNFILLKRIKVKLTETQISYLATLQSIPQHIVPQYTKYMTTGICEIILISKRSALYEAHALAQGCICGPSSIPTTALKTTNKYNNQIPIQTKKGRDVYQQQLPIYPNYQSHQSINHQPTTQIFKSIHQLIDIEKVLFGQNLPPQYTTNIKTGQINRIDPHQALISNQPIPVTHKIKQSILKQLKKGGFNFWVYTSKSETITQQLAGMFLPQCTLIQSITILVKPGLIHLVPLIKKSLTQHKYHIILQKQIQMNQQIAKQFLTNCQKIRLSNQIMKQLIKIYSKQKVYLFSISKISGRKQIMSMLSSFSFFTSTTDININAGNHKINEIFINDEDISDELLYNMLIPVWNNDQLLLRMVSQPLAQLQQTIISICNNNQPNNNNNNSTNQNPSDSSQPIPLLLHRKNPLSKLDRYLVLNYLVGSFYGVSIDDLQMNTRLGKLCYYIALSIDNAKLQSWYYAKIASIKPNYVPLLFQYRQIGTTVLCIQSDKGIPFIYKLLQMYNQQQQKMKKIQQYTQHNFLSKPKKYQRRSLVLFLWAKKLIQLCFDLMEIETQMKNYGDIRYSNGQYQGQYTAQYLQKQQYKLLQQSIQNFKKQTQIVNNIKKLFKSRHMKQRYTSSSKRLLPFFLTDALTENLRVVEKTQATKLHLMDKFTSVDPQNQVSKLKDLYSLYLFNVVPSIRTKYAMLAQLYYSITKTSLQNPTLSQITTQFTNIFSDLLTDHQPSFDTIQFQLYLRYLIQYNKLPPNSQLRQLHLPLLKNYPNLTNNRKIDRDQGAGKKRKYLDHKYFFKRNYQENNQNQEFIQKQYMNIDINVFNPQKQPSPLYNPSDPLHRRFASAQKRINLLRDTHYQQDHRTGIYVQYQKNISEKEELLKAKIKKQVQKFNYHVEDQIFQQKGLEKNLWYRRTKGEGYGEKQSKSSLAIQKQIQKLMNFKEDQMKKNNGNMNVRK